MASKPIDARELIGMIVVIANADKDMLNLVNIHTGKQYWIEATELRTWEKEAK